MRFHHALLLTVTLSGTSCGLFPEEAPPEPIRTTPAVQTVRLEISGMTCGLTDGTRLNDALAELEWIDACRVDFSSRSATLRAREDRIDPVSLWRTVGELGFEVRLASGVDAPPTPVVEELPAAEPESEPRAAAPPVDEDDFFGPELPAGETDPQLTASAESVTVEPHESTNVVVVAPSPEPQVGTSEPERTPAPVAELPPWERDPSGEDPEAGAANEEPAASAPASEAPASEAPATGAPESGGTSAGAPSSDEPREEPETGGATASPPAEPAPGADAPPSGAGTEPEPKTEPQGKELPQRPRRGHADPVGAGTRGPFGGGA